MSAVAPITVLVSSVCDACGARPCGEDDILCVECRAKVRARKAARLTPAQSAEVRSLIDDSGYTRAEAVAWVRAFPAEVSS